MVGDVIAGIAKYEKPIPAQLAGIVIGAFPTSIVPKTDEPNFQAVPDMIAAITGQLFYSTVKADGSSGTMFNKDGEIGVCSRNLQLKEDNNNAFWKVVKKYNLHTTLENNYAIQFELCGPGIQQNPMGLEELDMRVFNVWDIVKRKYLNAEELVSFCDKYNIPMVEIVDWNDRFMLNSDEELRKYAEGKYDSGKHREGIVIRPMTECRVNGERLSFKVINLNFKDA
jgi:RNA ligase (TIGR02306 family)